MERTSKYAIFKYQKSEEDLIKDLAEYLEANAQKIYDFFEIEIPDEKININIIPTKKEFDEKYLDDWKFKAAKWSRGYYKNNKINYLSINDYINTSHAFKKEELQTALELYKKTLIHEYVHYVNELFILKNQCSPTQKYLSEGIAVYLSEQKKNRKIKFDFTLEQILSKDDAKFSYAGGYLTTKYLIENYNKEFVFQLFKSNRQAREFLVAELYEKTKTHCEAVENEI